MKKPVKPKAAKTKPIARRTAGDAPRCGQCGKTKKLTRTECCDQWICDDTPVGSLNARYGRTAAARTAKGAIPVAQEGAPPFSQSIAILLR